MKIRKIAYLSTLFAILLPTLVVATVVISYTYPTTIGNPTYPTFYVAEGKNYPIANSLGLISLSGSSGNLASKYGTLIPNGTTITLTPESGADLQLLDVFVINNTGSSTQTVTIEILSSSITGGSAWLYATQNTQQFPLWSNPNALKLSLTSNGGYITVTVPAQSSTSGTPGTYYIGFELSGSLSGSAELTFYTTT